MRQSPLGIGIGISNFRARAAMVWRELGFYCLHHGRDEEMREVGALAEVYEGWSGGRRR